MATANTNIKINIVEPGSSTPVDPTASTTTTTDISAPDTGLFTHGIGGTEATIITISIVAILAVVATILHYKKKHNNKATESSSKSKLTNIISTIKSKKKVSIPLAILALVVSLGTLATLLVNAGKSNTNAAEENTEETASSLTLDVDSEELTIEVGDTPVFAVLPVKLTVEEATKAGYTLTAYTKNTDLVSTTNPNNKIPMVTVEGDELTILEDNTWGLTLDNEPEAKDNKVYTALSTDQTNPTLITDKDYEETEANDTTTIYYGFYITPDIPYGVYTGGEVEYEAEENTATVIFDGNGKFYFNGDTSTTANIMNYIPGEQSTPQYSHTPNINDEGVQDGKYPLNSNETFVYDFPEYKNTYLEIIKTEGDYTWPNGDYFSIWSGSHPEYTALDNYGNDDSIKNLSTRYGQDGRYYFYTNYYTGSSVYIANDSATIAYTTNDDSGFGTGYGYYAKVIGYNPSRAVAGVYEKPETDGAYRFLGWSEDKDATTPTYKTITDVERALSLSSGGTVTLYAISEPAIVITYNGNGADATTDMNQVEQYTTNVETTSQVDLLASNFAKEGYGFVGWSANRNAWNDLIDDDESNNPTIYGPNQMITVDPSMSTRLNLYAVWAPAETDNSGNPVSLQNWQDCSTLTPTTYDSATNTLAVGKNTITALTDNRDGNIYTVARLADGNCWMTENLRLDNESELSQQNTHNPSLPLTNNYAEQITSNKLSVSSNDWCMNYDDPTCYDQSLLNTINTTFATDSPIFSQDYTNVVHQDLSTSISSYGNYYNWYSATAGNGKQETTSTTAGDICPAGWQLPVGNNNNISGSFYYLSQQMGANSGTIGSNSWRSFPNNFVYSGYLYYGSSMNARGYGGYYWSSTALNTGRAYRLLLVEGSVDPGTNSPDKSYGSSVRCLISV